MSHWNLTDDEFYDWAVKKVASDLLIEQREEFAKSNPSERLTRIYHVLDEKVAPIFTANGIPISREELHHLFLRWFVERATPKRDSEPYHPEDGTESLGGSIVFLP